MEKKVNLLLISAVFAVVVLFSSALFINTKSGQQSLNEQLAHLESSIKDEYKKRLKESVYDTIKFIDIMYEYTLKTHNTEGEKLGPEGEKFFLDEVRTYFYTHIFDTARYSWVNKIVDFNGGDRYAIRLIHPNLKKTEGQFLSTNATDIKGNLPYLEELEGVKKSGEVYFTYYFKQLNSTEMTEKLSYAKLYKRLNWVIATGIPVNTLNKMIAAEKEKLIGQFEQHRNVMLLFNLGVVLLFVVMLFIFRNRIFLLIKEKGALNQKYQEALEATSDGIWEWNLVETNLFLSPPWKSMLGYTDTEIANTFESWTALLHPDDKAYVLSEVTALKSHADKHYEIEFRMQCKDGTYKWILSRAKTVETNQKGQPLRVIGTHVDIQKTKEMEAELKVLNKQLENKVREQVMNIRQKDQLLVQQSKMAAMGEMIGVIVHQWKQPLNIIALNVQMIDEIIEDEDSGSEMLWEIRENILVQIQHMNQTINDFRNFFKPDAEAKSFRVCKQMTEVHKLLSAKLQNLQVDFNICEHDHVMVLGKPNELKQVLMNLYNNACDTFVERDIKTRRIENLFENNETTAIIRIRDTGGGIPEALLPDRLFESYVSTKGDKGTGIGLQICKSIIEEHMNGKISVHNVENGAEFVIELPLA